MLDTIRFLGAVSHAITIHSNDVRKGTAVPYATHLLGTCALVLADGGSEDEAIAALLHDSIEDHPESVTVGRIAEIYGERVATIVEGCTDTVPDHAVDASWRQRKVAYLKRLRRASPDVLRVALADKLDNARAILSDYRELGDAIWIRFGRGKSGQMWYYPALVQTFRDAGASGPMMEEFARVVSDIEELVGYSEESA